jgi:hypothetical protein
VSGVRDVHYLAILDCGQHTSHSIGSYTVSLGTFNYQCRAIDLGSIRPEVIGDVLQALYHCGLGESPFQPAICLLTQAMIDYIVDSLIGPSAG